jgi:hypothetical protein
MPAPKDCTMTELGWTRLPSRIDGDINQASEMKVIPSVDKLERNNGQRPRHNNILKVNIRKSSFFHSTENFAPAISNELNFIQSEAIRTISLLQNARNWIVKSCSEHATTDARFQIRDPILKAPS